MKAKLSKLLNPRTVLLVVIVGLLLLGASAETDSEHYIPMVLLNILAFFIAIFVYELGHFTAGLIVGLDFAAFAVGPFQISRVVR